MSIIIKGMDMPKDGLYYIADGKIHKYKPEGGTVRQYDLIEIVTCEECKYCETYAVSDDTPIGRWCHGFSIIKAVESDNFCSYGERRKDEHTD